MNNNNDDDDSKEEENRIAPCLIDQGCTPGELLPSYFTCTVSLLYNNIKYGYGAICDK